MKSSYNRDGYAVLRGILADLPWVELEPIQEMLIDAFSISKEWYLREARLLGKSLLPNTLFFRPAVRDAIFDIVKSPVFLTSPTTHFMGIDTEFEGTGAHQDWPALQSSLNAVVVWIPLTDVTLDTFPVELVPGSHKLGLLPAVPGEHYSSVDTTGMEFVPIEMKRGDVLLFSVFTVHRTRTPGTGFRLALSHRYEDALDPWFVAHNHYSAQRRVIDREVKFTPTADQVRRLFEVE